MSELLEKKIEYRQKLELKKLNSYKKLVSSNNYKKREGSKSRLKLKRPNLNLLLESKDS
jgi:hypothetical protein